MYVQDLEAATHFYTDVLGFTPTVGLEGINQELETGGPPLVLHAGGTAPQGPRGLNGAVPSFTVDNLETTVAELKRRGVHTVMDPREVPHGWIYFFADPEGNTLQLYQPRPAHGEPR